MTEISETVRVRAPREMVYEMWRDPETFVEIVSGLEDAQRSGRSLQWEASGPLGLTMRGEAELTQERKPERLAWNTIEGTLDAQGSIDFEEDGEETLVHYALRYDVPGGAAGEAMANLAAPEEHVRATLQRFKELAESRRRDE